ncbi:hypothetical protein [Demetria terragena]|uniref:hypothetical protein n=1 Tax=Demetria terragena TaxID=63959 RepID=UPI00036B1A50|nr:hypothetical protein [Demetria terragena]
MAADGPVDMVTQGNTQREICNALFRGLSASTWLEAKVYFAQAGDRVTGTMVVIDDRGHQESRPVPGELFPLLLRLRDEMWNPQTLPWYHVMVTMSPDGQARFFFNYERRFDLNRPRLDYHAVTDNPDPTDADLIADLALFPRSPEHIPSWYPRPEDLPTPPVDAPAQEEPAQEPAPKKRGLGRFFGRS